MSLSSFLTQAPIQYAQGASQTSTSLPSWYSDYTQGILANAAQWAGQGYQPYGGPQVAPLTGDQQSSYGTVRDAKGLGSGIAQAGVSQAYGSLNQPNALQGANPSLKQAAGGINSALSGPNALNASNPYLSAAATPLSSQIGNFMNPYINNVVNATDAISARNFNQNVLPALQDQFTQSGQVYGGSRQGYEAALLGSQENLNEQMTNASLLNSGYNTALGGAEAQSGLLAGLGSTAANAGNAVQGNNLYGAGLTAGLGSTAGSLANAAQQTGLYGASTLGQLGTTAQQNALQQATAQNQLGTQQQQQTQNNYSTAYQNFLNQKNFPALAAQEMGGALAGIQIPGATTQYNTQPYGLGTTGFQNLAGGIGLGNSLGNILGGGQTPAARGGHVRGLAFGGQPKHVSFLPNVRPVLGLKPRVRSPLAAR